MAVSRRFDCVIASIYTVHKRVQQHVGSLQYLVWKYVDRNPHQSPLRYLTHFAIISCTSIVSASFITPFNGLAALLSISTNRPRSRLKQDQRESTADMAAVMSDFGDSSRFHHGHSSIANPGRDRSPTSSSYSHKARRTDHPPTPGSRHAAATPPLSTSTSMVKDVERIVDAPAKSGPPSPPSSSSPSVETYPARRFPSQENLPGQPYKKSPHIAFAGTQAPQSSTETFPRSTRSLDDVTKYGGNTIKVRDLAHIRSFATEEFLTHRGTTGRRRTSEEPVLKYEISGMPITDIIEMVAGLLTKITTTNDRQHETLNRPLPSNESSLSGYSPSVLAFHGKNVPSITIVSYLARIHKYCPTTYEVFLSLLVYFDRMTERVNTAPIQVLRQNSDLMDEDTEKEPSSPSTSYSADGSDLADSPPPSRSVPESTDDLQKAQYLHIPSKELRSEDSSSALPLSHFFVVDSFNIHRLVIAGVTCASKFFSDVFYTNSRYAKVCVSAIASQHTPALLLFV